MATPNGDHHTDHRAALYYAAGAAALVTPVFLVVLWCVIWSSAALFLVYRTRLLWPVVIGHGLNDVVETFHGPFDPGTGLLAHVAVLIPQAILMAICVAAWSYAMPRLVNALLKAITQRWPRLARKPQLVDTLGPAHKLHGRYSGWRL